MELRILMMFRTIW